MKTISADYILSGCSMSLAMFAMVFFVAICCTLAGVLLARFFRARQHLKSFPGPKPWFLLGNLSMLMDQTGRAMPLFKLHSLLQKQYGSIVRFTMGATPVLIISGTVHESQECFGLRLGWRLGVSPLSQREKSALLRCGTSAHEHSLIPASAVLSILSGVV